MELWNGHVFSSNNPPTVKRHIYCTHKTAHMFSFSSHRWKQQRVRLAEGGNSSASGGRLGDACSRLLGALVLASAIHPGTLMADLGAAQGPESPTVR